MADPSKTVTAEYEIQKHTLTVQSTPVAGVSITGTKPGTTIYTATCTDHQALNLSAPPTATVAGSDYSFVRWTVDGAAKPDLQTSLSLTMYADHTATAVYFRHCTLSVRSSPITGVNVLGDKTGKTDYAVEFEQQQSVTLSAQPGVVVGIRSFPFVWWTLDGVPQPLRQANLQLTMDTDHTAVAVYNLLGDVNGDCRVNVLDLILVRNRLGQNVASGDNWKVDVNQDGATNVLDLILVRNNLNTSCP